MDDWIEQNPQQGQDDAFEQGWMGVSLQDIIDFAAILGVQKCVKLQKGIKIGKKQFRHLLQSIGYQPPGCYRMYLFVFHVFISFFLWCYLLRLDSLF